MATRAADLDFPPAGLRRPRFRAPRLTVIDGSRQDAPARFDDKRGPNWPLMAAIAAAHVAGMALLVATGTVSMPVSDKPVVVTLVPEIVKPQQPPPPAEPTLEPVTVEIFVPPVAVETPLQQPSPVTVTTVLPPPPAPVASAVSAEPGPPVGAPVTPPDFRAAQLDNPGPRYPAMSRRQHEQGTTVLKVLVSPEGRARELAVQSSSGFNRLDDAALETVKRWKFMPAKQAGRAVTAWVLVPVTFALA